ncbi:pantetheine-phosphate adenylyltransferase [Sphingobacterium sp. LRF_L2]|uniref:pantetheine-phosphate adenylyltransferase n=1 Tax=Sphingobacterium sp. LRF_L2 TaxID=3369421 RepID=UPI003F6079BA
MLKLDIKIAVFAGSFDPFTFAHKDIVDRGLCLFDKVVIAVGKNSAKTGVLPFEDRVESIKQVYKNNERIEVEQFNGLTVDFCKRVGANFILRGLRNTNDFLFEQAIAQNNLLLAPTIETYFLACQTGLGHISSTIVRDIWMNQGDISKMVPEEVLFYLKRSK